MLRQVCITLRYVYSVNHTCIHDCISIGCGSVPCTQLHLINSHSRNSIRAASGPSR